MEKPRTYRDFDLPTKHLEEGLHFVPPKARDEEEIERRRALPKGVLLAEFQGAGLAMASSILKHITQPGAIEFARRIIPAAGVNTAWYSYGWNFEHEVMRRRLKLPVLAMHSPELRPTSSDIRHDAAFRLDNARQMTSEFSDLLHQPDVLRVERARDRKKRSLGQSIGNTSLLLACEDFGDRFIESPLTEADTSELTRQRSLQLLLNSRALHNEIGQHPSMAAFGDPDSHLSVFWRREAPTDAVRAYHAAAELTLAA